jgi:multiple sugar transport system permease protein
MKWDGIGHKKFIGIANFSEDFNDLLFWKALLNTCYYTILVVPGGVIIALIVAIGLNKIGFKNFYRVFYFMPVVTSSVAVGIIWMWVLNPDFGLLNSYLQNWFGIKGPGWLTDPKIAIPAIALISIWWGLGYNMVIFLAGLKSIDRTYYEAAEIDGASKFKQFLNITIPLLSPTTFFVVIMSFIGSFQVFDQAFVMTSGGPARASYTLVYHIYETGFVRFEFGKSASVAMILFVIILAITLIQLYGSRKWVHYQS